MGRLSDRYDRFTLFSLASGWPIVMVLFYTHLTPAPFLVILACNVTSSAGLAIQLVPSIALITALPDPQDRGVFMSMNSSLQQLAGGIAAIAGGLIVRHKTEASPLEHYDTLGYMVVSLSALSILLMRQVSQLVKATQATRAAPPVPAAHLVQLGAAAR